MSLDIKGRLEELLKKLYTIETFTLESELVLHSTYVSMRKKVFQFDPSGDAI